MPEPTPEERSRMVEDAVKRITPNIQPVQVSPTEQLARQLGQIKSDSWSELCRYRMMHVPTSKDVQFQMLCEGLELRFRGAFGKDELLFLLAGIVAKDMMDSQE